MSRWFLVFLAVVPACLNPVKIPGSSTGSTGDTSDSSTGESSTGGVDSTSSGDEGGQSSDKTGSGGMSTADTTTGDPSAGTDASSTGVPPWCGDGVVDPGEECDDGNADLFDDCGLCARRRLVFITSELFTPELIGGIAGADNKCMQFANKAGHPHPWTYMAWISDSTSDAAERLFLGKHHYVRTDGVIVAKDALQFVSGQLEAPINLDEWGKPVEVGSAWTGTMPDGSAVTGATHCNDWTIDGLSNYGHFGTVSATDSSWTYQPNPELNPIVCGSYKTLYCIEGE
jgi:hypothetical protein